MRQTTSHTFISIVILAAALGVLTSCGSGGGGGNGGNGGTTLTQSQAQEVGTSVTNDLSLALSSALSSPAAGALDIGSRDHIRVALERKSETQPVTKPDTLTCTGSNCTLSGTYMCPDGGSIGVSGNLSSTSNSVSATVTETPTNCSDGTLDVSGDPNMTLGLQASDNGVSTSLNATVSGGVSFSPVQAGQFPSGTCTCNLTLTGTVNDSNATVTACSVHGSICGQSINVSNCASVP